MAFSALLPCCPCRCAQLTSTDMCRAIVSVLAALATQECHIYDECSAMLAVTANRLCVYVRECVHFTNKPDCSVLAHMVVINSGSLDVNDTHLSTGQACTHAGKLRELP